MTRVVVTGIGLVTVLGASREATWAALRAGRSAARWINPDSTGSPRYAGFPVWLPPDDPEDDEPVLRLLRLATLEALADARLVRGAIDPDRLGCLIGLSKGCLRGQARVFERLAGSRGTANADPRGTAQLWLERSWANVGATFAAKWADARGPCLAPVAACATGLVAVLQGADLIRRGVCDAVLAGASDASLEPFVLAAFRRMKALARCEPGQDDPARAVRPLDRRRSGFLVGEGAAVLILERAGLRDVGAYAEIAGGALGSDAYHLTDLNPDPANLAGLIDRALREAEVPVDAIDHVNLHGTATRSNDPLECRAVRAAVGSRANELLASANKAQIGHLLGAAGANELAITCLAIRDGVIPPTLHREQPDPECRLATTPVAIRRPIRAALKLSLGFGGHLAAAVLKSPD